MAHIAKQLLAQPYIVIQFFNARMVGVHARVIRPPAECMAAVRAILDEACKYDSTLRSADFRAAENRYYNANPAEETPISLKEVRDENNGTADGEVFTKIGESQMGLFSRLFGRGHTKKEVRRRLHQVRH